MAERLKSAAWVTNALTNLPAGEMLSFLGTLCQLSASSATSVTCEKKAKAAVYNKGEGREGGPFCAHYDSSEQHKVNGHAMLRSYNQACSPAACWEGD